MLNEGDQIRRVVADRLRALGLSMKKVSREIGQNETYLQQYIAKGSPKYIPEQLRPHLAEILGLPEDQLKPPPLAEPGARKPAKPKRKEKAALPPPDTRFLERLIALGFARNEGLGLGWDADRIARAITLAYQAALDEEEPDAADLIGRHIRPPSAKVAD